MTMDQRERPLSILFITASFDRTGSEMLLLNLIKGVDRRIVKSHLYCQEDGQLLAELPKEIAYFLPYYKRKKRKEKLWRSLLKRLKQDPFEYQLKSIQQRIKADIWYINTIVVDPRFLKIGKQLGVKIITHFHELPNAYRFITKVHLQSIIQNSDVCIGCSKIVCEKIRELGHKDVRLQYSFIDTEAIEQQLTKPVLSRDALGIPEHAFVWAISGRVTYEKGVDYIPAILAELADEDIRIIWLGNNSADGLGYYIETIAEKQWPGKMIFTGALKEQYYPYLMLADGLLMPSREDSFSLVMLEAAYLGKPIVSFNSGGVKEFVNPDKGIVVDSWNAADLVKAMRQVMHSGRDVRARDVSFEFNLSYQISHFQQLIKELI